MEGSDCSPIAPLEGRQMLTLMLYLLEHDGCGKTEVYRAISRSTRFPGRMDRLIEEGLIRVDDSLPGRQSLHLTDLGRDVAERIAGIRDVLSQS